MSVHKGKLLIVDDEQGIRELLVSEFSKLGYSVFFAVNGEDAILKLQAEKADLIITDMKMPKVDGVDLLKFVKEHSPESEVIIITGYATVENALEAMHRGAYDFIQKPFNIDELVQLAEKAMEKNELKTLVSIYEEANSLFSHLNLKDLLPAVSDAAKKITGCLRACLFLLDNDGKILTFCQNDCGADKKEVGKFVSDVYSDETKRGEPIFFDAVSAPQEYKSIFVPKLDIKSVLLYPMSLSGKITGYLFLTKSSQFSPFTKADLKKISVFVSQISQAVNNAQAFERLSSNNAS
ncbi:MAG: response regulator [Endomicrobia bacterium]|nr:response regulator [Endomicrobiia bacterium]MCL2507371.1 response regulator [Endomicrobiia bacterium]